jgi:putative hemolysin
MDFWIVITITLSAFALLASAFFATAEVAIFSVRPKTLQTLNERNDPRSKWLSEVLAQPRRFLVTILLGNTISNAVFAGGITLLYLELLPHQQPLSWWIPILITLSFLILFGELIPKAVTTRKVTSIALRIVGLLRSLERLFSPITRSLDSVSQKWATRMMPRSLQPIQGLTEDEYLTMLDVGTREGTLRPSEQRLIQKTLNLADRNLRELMTPRGDMCCIDVEIDLDQMKKQAIAMKHRRLPLYSESLDSIVGVLNVRRFLLEPDAEIMASVEPPAFVPETMSALELLKSLLRGPQRMAMVMDEFGGVEGLITLEDIAEEVFGEIYDEYDDASPDWIETAPHTYLVRGSAHLPVISEWLKVEIEADGIDTLGGWLTDKIGALPKIGDQFSYEGYFFQVEKLSRFRVKSILIKNEKHRR